MEKVMTDKTKDVFAEAAELALKKFPPRLVTITQDRSQLEPTVEADQEEINLKSVLEQRFAAGQGVVTLSANMTDEQILTLIKGACTWSNGKAFQVIPPQAE